MNEADVAIADGGSNGPASSKEKEEPKPPGTAPEEEPEPKVPLEDPKRPSAGGAKTVAPKEAAVEALPTPTPIPAPIPAPVVPAPSAASKDGGGRGITALLLPSPPAVDEGVGVADTPSTPPAPAWPRLRERELDFGGARPREKDLSV